MRSRKPCPGCGEVVRFRAADSVCSACEKAIKNWNAYAERLASPGAGMVTVGMKGAYHWYPQFYFGGPNTTNDELDDLRSTLAETFAEFGNALCVDVVPEESWSHGSLFPHPEVENPKWKSGTSDPRLLRYPCSDGSRGGCMSYGSIRKDHLDMLRKLWDATARFAHIAWLSGLQDGRDLLKQLAQGDITSDELQEKDVRIASAVQNAKRLHEAVKKLSEATP